MFATSGNAQLAYEVSGTGREVLLIHAGVTDRRAWAPVVARLDARCLTYDMRAYGETRYAHEDGWSKVGDALAVMDAAGFQKPLIVAGSMGGKCAIDLTLAHPERVAGLCLIGTAVRGAPFDEPTEGPTARLNQAIEATEDIDAANRLEAWLWLDGPGADEGRVSGEQRELFLEMNERALRAEDPGPEAETPDAWPRLGEIAVPTLLLLGRLDSEEIIDINEPLADLIPGARLVWLDGVAHLPAFEGDPATLDAIAEFIASAP